KNAFSFDRPEDDRSLGVYFVSLMKDGQLLHIVERQIRDEVNVVTTSSLIVEVNQFYLV
ncbi:wall-associated receptor kinase 3-like, partial [Trifolium medium]|nr:wall-associated receptor kinase 3-like [Trifolium medium]